VQAFILYQSAAVEKGPILEYTDGMGMIKRIILGSLNTLSLCLSLFLFYVIFYVELAGVYLSGAFWQSIGQILLSPFTFYIFLLVSSIVTNAINIFLLFRVHKKKGNPGVEALSYLSHVLFLSFVLLLIIPAFFPTFGVWGGVVLLLLTPLTLLFKLNFKVAVSVAALALLVVFYSGHVLFQETYCQKKSYDADPTGLKMVAPSAEDSKYGAEEIGLSWKVYQDCNRNFNIWVALGLKK